MKKIFLKTIIALVFIIILDGLFFLFKDISNCPDSVLSALIGLNIAYFSLFLVPICALKQNGTKVLSDTLYLIGAIYFILEFIVGITFLFWEQDTMILPVIIQSVLFGLYIIILLGNVLANDATQKSINNQNAESDNIKAMIEQVETILYLIKDDKAYKLVTSLYEDLKVSPIRSNIDVVDIEKEISISLMQMHNLAKTEENSEVIKIAAQIKQLIAQRNFKLKNTCNY